MSVERPNEIAVVLVNYHSEDQIDPLAREYAASGLQVVVVDNSGTYPVHGVARRIASPTNLGFGQACNLGVAALDGSVSTICLHNPDVDPCLDTIISGAVLLNSQARPGIVAPAEDIGGLTRLNGYRYPSPAREVVLGVTGGRSAAGPRRTFRGRGRRFAGAGLLLVSRQAWRVVDGFDPDYFMYVEDLDLWHRVVRAGFDCAFAPELSYRHRAGTGSPMPRQDRDVLRWLGIELFAAKHSAVGWRPYRMVHEQCLSRLNGTPSALALSVAMAWKQGLEPAAVIAAVRPQPSDEPVMTSTT